MSKSQSSNTADWTGIAVPSFKASPINREFERIRNVFVFSFIIKVEEKEDKEGVEEETKRIQILYNKYNNNNKSTSLLLFIIQVLLHKKDLKI